MRDELKRALMAELASGPIERENLLVRLYETGLLEELESSGGDLAAISMSFSSTLTRSG